MRVHQDCFADHGAAVDLNFILYLAVQQAIQFLPNIMVSRMVDKEFPYLKECHELPEREERNGILKISVP